MKKMIALMLTAVLAATVFAGCAAAPAPAAAPAAPAAPAESQAEPAPVEVPEGATAWTVTCPWAPSGVAAMVNQKAAAMSTTYSDDIILVATAEKGGAATLNSWLKRVNDGDPEMIFGGEGIFSITTILDPEVLEFGWDDFKFIQNLYSSIFVMSATAELGLTDVAALENYLKEGNKVRLAANGAVGSEAFLAAALIGAMGYGDQLEIIPYQSAAEAAQAVSRGETELAISHQSQILETYQQGGVTIVCAFDENDIDHGEFAGVEGVGKHGYPYFRNRCFIFAKAGISDEDVEKLRALYSDILTDEEVVSWLNDTMLLEADMMSEEEAVEFVEYVKGIVEEYKSVVGE